MKHALLLTSFLALSGCLSTVASVSPPKIIAPPDPVPIATKPVEFIVVTKDNLEKLNSQPVWYAIDPDTYENIAYNFQEVLRYIRDQKAIILYYRSVTSNEDK